MGHRGNGMNMLQSSDRRMKSIKENSILSFNSAAKFPIHFVELDVQVTKDDCPIIFHDIYISTEEKGVFTEKRVTDLSLDEFLSYGTQKEPGKVGKPLFRMTKDGRIFEWKVENDGPLCTSQEGFEEVQCSVGFNVELKFDDLITYTEDKLMHIIQVVNEFAKDRLIMFSSFQPDAALLLRKIQSTYPVFFLTNGGSQFNTDNRRNSLDEAIKVCIAGGLQGIVSEVAAILKNPGAVSRTRDSRLSLITYGQLNNVREVVLMEHSNCVDGVIVDLVQEITEAVSDYMPSPNEIDGENLFEQKAKMHVRKKPLFSA